MQIDISPCLWKHHFTPMILLSQQQPRPSHALLGPGPHFCLCSVGSGTHCVSRTGSMLLEIEDNHCLQYHKNIVSRTKSCCVVAYAMIWCVHCVTDTYTGVWCYACDVEMLSVIILLKISHTCARIHALAYLPRITRHRYKCRLTPTEYQLKFLVIFHVPFDNKFGWDNQLLPPVNRF